ncbi:MAG: SusC/RagA family TonB-linked outer membrane protein [Bacteroidota bacterium]
MKVIFTKANLLLLLFVLALTPVWAQFSATGTVTDSEGEPIIGATVAIKGTALGTLTDTDGKFSLRVQEQSAVLVISYFGFATQEQEVSSSTGDLEVQMTDVETTLDEVVVTGLATSVKRSNLANSVASIDAEKLTGITNQQTMDGALYGKFKGAEIRSNSGAPGGGISVRLRGVTSVFGDQQPLFIVDGVYVDNSTVSLGTNIVTTAAGGGNTASNQDDASNRIADIDPEDIENIEILKGASAAAIYGSRAAGGVVIITTKRGRAGRTRVSLSQTSGITRPLRFLGTRDWTPELVESEFGAEDRALFEQNGNLDYERQLYDRTGYLNTTRVNISGGNAKTSFFLGGTYKSEDGIVENTGYDKTSVRVNVSHRFNEWLDVNVTNNYINSTADRGLFNNSNSNTTIGYAMAFTKPWVDLRADENGNFPANTEVGSNVLETVALTTNRERVNRYVGGATLTARLLSTERNQVKVLLRGGLDQYALTTTGLFPSALSYYQDPASLGGASIQGNTINTNTNLEAFLVHTYYGGNNISFRTQVGVQQLDFNRNTLISTATGLNGSQTNLDQAANIAIEQIRLIQQDKGIFIQEEFNYNDQFIVTAGVRADKSSNNGDPNQLYYYPKANAAVNLHTFDFWTIDPVSQFKLRVAYGQSGRFSNFGDKFTSYNPVSIAGLSGAPTSGLVLSTLRGNPNVGPERQAELEFGADFGFVNNRITLDVTYYIKTVTDLLLEAQVPTSTGFTRQIQNAGALENRGLEIGLNVNPVQTKDFDWNFTINWWRNRSEITELGVPAFNVGGFAASLGQYRIQEGQSATQIVGTINPDDCATADCSDLDPDLDGFRVYGDAQSDFDASLLNDIRYKNFSFTFLLHWKQGGDAINLSTLLYDLGQLTWDYDDLTLDPEGLVGNGPFRLNSWFAGDTGPWVEDAGYVRLREVGLYYTIPKSALNDVLGLKVGVSGRNLLNFFNYNSYDPEVSNFGNNVLANAVEVTPYPSARRFFLNLTANF